MGSDSYPVFYKCKALKTINIGNDVKSIPNNAFIGCDSITTVNYNAENCSSMGSAYNSVFSGCKVLNTINIGNNVKTIPKYAFNNIASLITVNFNAENCSSMDTYYSSVFNGCKALNIINIGNNVTRIPNYAFCNCIGLTSISLPNSATSIGSYAFAYCDGLTSVTIPNSVTEIGSYAFNGTAWYNNQADGVIYINNVLYEYKGTMPDNTSINIKEGTVSISPYAFDGCAGLTSATIPNSVTEIGSSAFKGCSGLTNLILEDGEDAVSGLSFPDSPLESLYLGRNTNYPFAEGKTTLKTLMIGNMVSSICNSAFHGCTSLTSITIPNSVTTIGSDAFNGCSGLTSVTIPNSVTSIGSSAFMGCTKLAVPKLSNTTQTTATVGFTSSSNCPPYLLCNNKYYKNGDKITGLTPGLEYGREYSYSYGLEINGNYCKINTTDSKFKTSPIYLYLNGTANVTSIIANGTHSIGDATFVSEGLDLNASGSFDNRNEKIFYNLDPNTSYYVYYGMKVKERTSPYYVSESFTTGDLDLTTQEAKPTSTTSIRLLASTNCDATEGTGFEWRRYDAPAELPSSKVTCPVVDGVLVGSLRGVNKDVYYKYRPYYTSSSGKTYYGDWIAFFTGDANVYFEPEVRTYDDIQVIQNSAVVKGYALEGTDVITAQGFEYWKTGTAIKPSSTDDRMTINASGISMSATLANLEYNSTYKYRAFVTTAKGTVYGDEVEFSTGDDPAGIGYIEMDSDEFAVTLRENPVTGTAWVKIAGAAGEEVQYTITSMSGAMVATGSVMLDGEWNAIDLNCPSGMYLLTINDSTQIKTLRLIVK